MLGAANVSDPKMFASMPFLVGVRATTSLSLILGLLHFLWACFNGIECVDMCRYVFHFIRSEAFVFAWLRLSKPLSKAMEQRIDLQLGAMSISVTVGLGGATRPTKDVQGRLLSSMPSFPAAFPKAASSAPMVSAPPPQAPPPQPPTITPRPYEPANVIVDTVPDVIAGLCGIESVSSCGWTHEQCRLVLSFFEAQILGEFGHEFWRSHQWMGVFAALAHKAAWNYRRCGKKTAAYQAMLGNYVAPLPLPGQGMPQQGEWNYPLVPCFAWGKGNHDLEKPCGVGDEDGQSSWWPVIVNPWIDAWGKHAGWSIQVPGCVWMICVSLACTNGRPWPVHRSRLRVVTDHIMGLPATAPTITSPSSSSWQPMVGAAEGEDSGEPQLAITCHSLPDSEDF